MRPSIRHFAALAESTHRIGEGIIARRRDALARGITLIESTRADHREQAVLLLDWLSNGRAKQLADSNIKAGNFKSPTLRIGVAGPPGAGKSTFIEALGMRFVSSSHRVAVVPIDPSSHISGGSILGDKTRMDQLSRSDSAYVRASPTRGVLGGIAEHTADVIFLCEAAGFNIVFVESVGLGQSEVDIDSAVDVVLVLVPPGGGDGLQASKKGIMEAADLVIVNKADGALLNTAKHTKADYSAAMGFIRRKHVQWQPSVQLVSAQTGAGLDDVEAQLTAFYIAMTAGNNALMQKRLRQAEYWTWGQFRRLVVQWAEGRPQARAAVEAAKPALVAGLCTPRAVAAKMLEESIRNT